MTTYTQAQLHERSLVQREAQKFADAAEASLHLEEVAASAWDCDLSTIVQGMVAFTQEQRDLVEEHRKVNRLLSLIEGWQADVSDLVYYFDEDSLDRAKGALEEMREYGVGTKARMDVWSLIEFCASEINRLATDTTWNPVV